MITDQSGRIDSVYRDEGGNEYRSPEKYNQLIGFKDTEKSKKCLYHWQEP
jgi:hypothetical protein